MSFPLVLLTVLIFLFPFVLFHLLGLEASGRSRSRASRGIAPDFNPSSIVRQDDQCINMQWSRGMFGTFTVTNILKGSLTGFFFVLAPCSSSPLLALPPAACLAAGVWALCVSPPWGVGGGPSS